MRFRNFPVKYVVFHVLKTIYFQGPDYGVQSQGFSVKLLKSKVFSKVLELRTPGFLSLID